MESMYSGPNQQIKLQSLPVNPIINAKISYGCKEGGGANQVARNNDLKMDLVFKLCPLRPTEYLVSMNINLVFEHILHHFSKDIFREIMWL